jgi:hypothetical protein
MKRDKSAQHLRRKKLKQSMDKARPERVRIQRAQNQMTLGSLIKALSRERLGLLVITSFAGFTPGEPHRYASEHNDLAFSPSNKPITVEEFLTVCQNTLMKPNIGPDPTFSARHSSPVWIATPDIASNYAVVDLVPIDGHISLILKDMD